MADIPLPIKTFAKRLLSPRWVGRLDYYRWPAARTSAGPFNGQSGREKLFQELLTKIDFVEIIETGCYRGQTTERFAETGLPVTTIEANPRTFGFAYERLKHLRNVRVVLGDSRGVLSDLLMRVNDNDRNKATFFYLDAHWNADLPLAEELDIVFTSRPNAVVMIDDFAVPGDPGYGYDDYGAGKALTAELITAAVKRFQLSVFFPSLAAASETGYKRGCVVLAKSAPYAPRLASCVTLRPETLQCI